MPLECPTTHDLPLCDAFPLLCLFRAIEPIYTGKKRQFHGAICHPVNMVSSGLCSNFQVVLAHPFYPKRTQVHIDERLCKVFFF